MGIQRGDSGLGGGSPPLYELGWPAGGTSEPDVVFQLTCDEASGNLIDTVSGIELTPVIAGGITYRITQFYHWLSRGVRYGASSSFFRNTDDNPELAPGTGDWTVEAAYGAGGNNNGVLIDCRDPANSRGWAVHLQFSAGRVGLRLKAEDDTELLITSGFIAGLVNWELRKNKIRCVFDRASDYCAVYINGGSPVASIWIGALAGKDIQAYEIRLANNHLETQGGGWQGTLHELRVSLNKTNNSGGPNGG